MLQSSINSLFVYSVGMKLVAPESMERSNTYNVWVFVYYDNTAPFTRSTIHGINFIYHLFKPRSISKNPLRKYDSLQFYKFILFWTKAFGFSVQFGTAM